jgi:general secretion pathway protein K
MELSANLRDEMKAYYIAKSGLHLADWVISNDEPETDDFTEQWASPILPLPIPEGELRWQVIDEASKLSLATLLPAGQEMPDEEFFQIFVRLFDILGHDENILDAILDWLDADDIPRGFYGAESNYYRSLKNSYSARNGNPESNYELFMIRWVTPAMILGTAEREETIGYPDGLLNYVTVYPTGKVNLNTASKPVLMALNERISQFEAQLILDSRDLEPFKSFSDVKKTGISEQYFNILKKYGSFRSDYFSVTMIGTVGRSKKILNAVFQRQQKTTNLLYYREET